ncbi:hypothetical protein AMJ85_02900 [candidate division BRC1 bacterium SM23_51]|nr:MAG: hypothetical protein AMJ85_02900 [candidate division BRC1 bacterium SM23_51]
MQHSIRWIVWIVVGAIVIVGIRFLAPIGYGLIYARVVPYRVTVTGQVTDGRGKPLEGSKVRTVVDAKSAN